MTPNADLLAAISNLAEVEAEIARLDAERTAIRATISELVATRYDNRAVVPGFGTLAIRAPSVAHVWDSRALVDVVQSLREQGYTDLADEIEGCKKQRAQAGGLAIVREKPASA